MACGYEWFARTEIPIECPSCKSRRWSTTSQKQQVAHAEVLKAIKSGVLKRMPCEICGLEPSEGHHRDYDHPLEVVWLCRSHHKLEHGKNGPGENRNGLSKKYDSGMRSEQPRVRSRRDGGEEGETVSDGVVVPEVRGDQDSPVMETGGLDLLKRICAGDRKAIDVLNPKEEIPKIEPAVEEEKKCSDCGGPLLWNRQMKWWECECGWHGKKER